MLLSIVFGVRKEYLLFQDDFETEQDKNISPIIKSFLDKKHRRDAVEACLKILGFTFEFIKIDILPKYTNMTNDEIFAMPKDEFSNVVKNIIEHERKYMLLDNEGNTIAVINDLTKERLTDEICDFIEFKICKMIGGSNEES
ncbi:MAG: hypothetical protein IJZ80_00590 [Clostridia bacterium]|nr:hypothetical protein [Clostridia bacterium]